MSTETEPLSLTDIDVRLIVFVSCVAMEVTLPHENGGKTEVIGSSRELVVVRVFPPDELSDD